jgi:hypothetical protein
VAFLVDTLAAWVPIAEIAGTKVHAADGLFIFLALAYLFRVFRSAAGHCSTLFG